METAKEALLDILVGVVGFALTATLTVGPRFESVVKGMSCGKHVAAARAAPQHP